MEKGRQVKMMNANEGCRRPRYENTDLIDHRIGTVEGAVFGEGGVVEREEECWSYTLVDGVLSDVYEEEREHAGWC